MLQTLTVVPLQTKGRHRVMVRAEVEGIEIHRNFSLEEPYEEKNSGRIKNCDSHVQKVGQCLRLTEVKPRDLA